MGEYERLSREQLAATLASLEAAPGIDADALKRTLHELQVHQVELEMQNRELREAQQLLEESRNRYVQLYDASPVGYMTLDLAGCLREVNLTAHKLLAEEHMPVIGRRFTEWVAAPERHKLLEHLVRCRRGNKQVRAVLTLQTHRGAIEAELCTVPDPHGGGGSRYLCVITDITEQKAGEEALRQSHEKLRQLTSHIESLRETERTRIAREVHDELGASLTAIKLDLDRCRRAVTSAKLTQAAERLAGAIRVANAAIASIRRICTDLRPSILDNLGLQAALEWQARTVEERTGIQCELVTPQGAGDLGLCPERITALFRIVQEALTNVVRHSGASGVRITLQCDAGGVGLEVKDNGRGFVRGQEAQTGSFGLLGMEERVRFLGGRFSIECAPGRGTAVRVYMPYAE